MNTAMRQRLLGAVKDAQVREILTFLYRDQPQGASFEELKELFFLHEAFQESQMQQLAEAKILTFDATRYRISADARQVLDRDPTILMSEVVEEHVLEGRRLSEVTSRPHCSRRHLTGGSTGRYT